MTAPSPARTPRTLWVELTSKCPFDCVFCSRKTLRGAGEHMSFAMFESLVRQVFDPRIFRLNYSGESTVYPELLPAIRLARSTGAFVELVSALASAPEALLSELASCGLNRLTVSLHTTSREQYDAIYRYASWDTLRSRLLHFAAACRDAAQPPILDFAFVAMDRNLGALNDVAALAESLGVHNIAVFPVIRRDEIPVSFPEELIALGDPRPDFVARVGAAVACAAREHPGVTMTIANPLFDGLQPCLGASPRPYPWPLPAGARIHSCEQNPWETVHVLANGDVVACEVLDRESLGNLGRQSLEEIWSGEAYRLFRERYGAGEIEACRRCPWKTACRPGPLEPEILAARGRNAQLLHGWHDPAPREGHIWSSQTSAAILAAPAGLDTPGTSCVVHVSGILPPGPDGANELIVIANGRRIGQVAQTGAESLPFGLDFPAPAEVARALSLEFRTRHVYRPSETGASADHRDLGFALVLLAAKLHTEPAVLRRRRAALARLRTTIHAFDALCRPLHAFPMAGAPEMADASLDAGLTILIPERDNAEELTACLAAVARAASCWIRRTAEPIETIVVANGSPAGAYRELQSAFPGVRWQVHESPLGFSGAVAAGLRAARFDWVYLLNSDAAPEPDALALLAPLREPRTFSIASQILLHDPTSFRDETNWTALLFENGLATIHDCVPKSEDAVEGFYAGGGASLFQTRLLRRVLDPSAYQPFYWEDVEWGWRARRLGYRCVFCPPSVVRHTRRATISRHYTAAEIAAVTERHRLLFQLRNLTGPDFLERSLDAIARAPGWRSFLEWRTILAIMRGRGWNCRAPIDERHVLEACVEPH